jgi:methylaspartate ammonia-lyase
MISKLHFTTGLGSYYREDIEYLQKHSVPVLDRYTKQNPKSGRALRVPAHVLSIGLELQSGETVWGDAIGVAFDGKSGREAALSTSQVLTQFKRPIEKTFTGLSTEKYRTAWSRIEKSLQAMPLSLQYGLSQGLLQAVAATRKRTPTEVLCDEWNLPLPSRAPNFHGSCGADKYHAAIKMMLHQLPSHPAGQGDDLKEVLGLRGEKLLQYAGWWKKSVRKFGKEYRPTFHFDLHGLLGKIFKDTTKAAAYLAKLERTLDPYPCRIESPFVLESREAQIAQYIELRAALAKNSSQVHLVADEWANTLDDIRAFLTADAVDWIHIKMPDLGPLQDSLQAVLECKKAGVGALLGGSCIETATSAVCSTHVALATQPNLLLIKPGMGFDEALSLANLEINRTLALLPAVSRGAV